MPKYLVGAYVRVTRTYVVEAEDQEQAVEKVEEVLNAGNYDDTDVTRWSSEGAVVESVGEAGPGETELPVDTELTGVAG